MEVLNPETGLPFTDAGAWNFIADLLDAGHPIVEVRLRRPPGETAFEMVVDMGKNASQIYIKVQIMKGLICGRSFHHSYRARKSED